MASVSEQIVDEFVAKGWKSNPFDKLVPMLRDEREQALPLALMVIDRVPRGGTFFDLLLSHLTENEFEQLIRLAVERLGTGPADVLDSVIAYASLQFPALLTPHLRALFSLRPNSGTYYEGWPWRGADEEEIGVLKGLVEKGPDQNIRERAWQCLVETRRAGCIEFAAEHFPSELDRGGGFAAYAHLVGFDVGGSAPRKLHTDAAHHVIFPIDYFDDSSRPIWNARSNHPTWTLEGPTTFEGDFGGEGSGRCGLCNGPLHRMVRLEQADSILGIRLPGIELCTCLSCLGWEAPELFFSHDELGVPSPLVSEATPREPEFPAKALKPAWVSVIASPPRWEFQDWALSNSRENLNRVGGSPSWIQDSQYPVCPKCQNFMAFIAQLDSDLPTSDGGEWLWGSGGICYVFWCDSCAVSGTLWQCT